MDYCTLFLVLIVLIIVYILQIFQKKSPKPNLPPGPKPWPIIGNIHLLGSKPHCSVTELSKKYGPLMTIKLGCITTVVISSQEVAKEMFTKHDLAFSSRQLLDAVQAIDHHKFSFVWLPVGPKWRTLRKIVTIQLFTSQRLDGNQGLRQKKVEELVQFARASAERGLAIDIRKAVSTTAYNLLSNTFFSRDCASYDGSAPEDLKDLNEEIMEDGSRPNVSDIFPWLRRLDLQGARRRHAVYFRKMVGIYGAIIEERLKDEAGVQDDVLSTLLKLVEEGELTLDDVKHMLGSMFIAGTDTTAATLEWTMTELLKHPEKLAKAQAEIDQVLGRGQIRLIEESYISNLSYIQAIVKETLRLHPPVPFLLPRKTESDVHLCGYYVPKNAQVWVNVWSICRDPTIWTSPEAFIPERFLESEIDYKGRNFEFMPFGSGRRICPGIPLAQRMMQLMLVNLLHAFSWKLDHGLNPEDIDIEEKFGIVVQKVQPLRAMPVPR